MRIAVPHNTTREIAREKVSQRLEQLLNQYQQHAEQLQQEWVGDTLRFKGKARGFALEGTVEVTDADVVIDSKLPLMAKPFEGRIRQELEREAGRIFSA